MTRRDADALANAQRTRTGRVWAALIPALLFLILLIIFIAENGQRVQVKFFGATGHVSLALALLIAAVAGAVIVLLIGGARIVQLRFWKVSCTSASRLGATRRGEGRGAPCGAMLKPS